MHLKSKLIIEVKAQLLASDGLMGMLADKVKTSHQTIKRQLIADSPIICQPHYTNVIKDLLGIPCNREITESYSINQPYEVTA